MLVEMIRRKVLIEEKKKKARIKTRTAQTKSVRCRLECYANIQLWQNEHSKFNDKQPLNRLHVAFLSSPSIILLNQLRLADGFACFVL